MRKFILILMLLPGLAMAQNEDTKVSYFDLGFGIGVGNHQGLTELHNSTSNPVASISLNGDFFPTKDFVLGPSVRLNVQKANTFLPNWTFGGLTGYDNGKFRFVGGVSSMSSPELADKPLNIDTFRGIITSEVGVGPVFVRGEWYTNLKTYFYSYALQLGFRVKL